MPAFVSSILPPNTIRPEKVIFIGTCRDPALDLTIVIRGVTLKWEVRWTAYFVIQSRLSGFNNQCHRGTVSSPTGTRSLNDVLKTLDDRGSWVDQPVKVVDLEEKADGDH
jgi:hypothetical protein